MYDCVVFEHLGQLLNLRQSVQSAAEEAGQTVGFRMLSPIENLNINTLKDLVCRDLHLPEDYYATLEKMMLMDALPGPHLEALCRYTIPMYVVGDSTQQDFSYWLLVGTPVQGFITSPRAAPYPLPNSLVVRDKADGKYPHEIESINCCDLTNLIKLLDRST